MKLKKVLCMAALSLAVALTGVQAGGVAEVVHAEETQFSNLDEILNAMYAYYVNGDYTSMYTLDVNDTTAAYAETIRNSGSDRYVIDLDGSTKAMMYVSPDGGYWWYFGEMANNLRQGNGTTIICNSNYTELFTGVYAADLPGGAGKMSTIYNNGSTFVISGVFQGAFLNGEYQLSASWLDGDGVPCSASHSAIYSNNHLLELRGDRYTCKVSHDGTPDWDNEGYILDFLAFLHEDYGFSEPYISVPDGYEVFEIGYIIGEGNYCYRYSRTEYLNAGLSVLKGNTTASAGAPIPEAATPAPEAAPTPETPVPEATPALSGTYTVERGDYLYKIAQKVYGDSTLWRIIYEANSAVIKDNYIIWANQVLVIPQL